MGFGFGDVWHVIDNVGQMVGHTAKDVATAEFASVPGLVWDLSSPIFTDNKFDPTAAISKAIGRAMTPLTDTQSITGAVISPVMHASEDVYREGVSEPLSTAMTMLAHVENTGDVGDLFDTSVWSKAYKVAQHRSIGQSLMLLSEQQIVRPLSNIPGLNSRLSDQTIKTLNTDPLAAKAWDKYHKLSPFATSAGSGLSDAVVRWYTDPLIVTGKALAALRAYNTVRPITAADRAAGIDKAMTEQTSKTLRLGAWGAGIGKQGLATRTDALVGAIKDGKYVEGAVDKFSTGQLQYALKDITDPTYRRTFAQLLEDTKYGDNVAAKVNARRFILRVAQGDTSALVDMHSMLDDLGKFRTKVDDLKELEAFHDKGDGMFSRAMAQGMDELENTAAQQTIMSDLAGIQDEVVKAFAQRGLKPPALAWGGDPAVVARAESQVKNLKALEKYIADNEVQLQRLDKIAQGLKISPVVRATGVRAASKAAGKGLLRSGEAATGHPALDRAAEHLIGKPLVRTYQSSPTAMPVRIVNSLLTKSLDRVVATRDVLGAERPTGMVNFNDIGAVSREFDNMLRKAGTPEATRLEFMAKVARTTNTYERQRLLTQVEQEVFRSIAEKHGVTNADDFLAAVQRRAGIQAESLSLARSGRAYSATLVREGNLTAEQRTFLDQNPGFQFRIDHVADDQIPTAMPVLDTAQDASIGMTIDVNALDKAFGRYAGIWNAAKRQWVLEHVENAHIQQATHLGGKATDWGLERYFQGKDKMMPFLDELNRAWKFAQLFRLGYLQRVLMDDHMRIMAKFGAETLRVGMTEGTKGWFQNEFVHPQWNAYQKKTLQTKKALLEDARGTDDLYEYNQRAWGQIARIEKKLETVRSAKRRAELEREREVLLDFHPENLAGVDQELREINEALRTGSFQRGNPNRFGKGRTKLGEGKFAIDGVDGTPVFIEDSFAGPYGAGFRQLNSSAGTFARMGASVESQVHGQLMRAGSYRTYLPTEDNHLVAWRETLNHQLRKSQLVRMAWEGKSEQEIARYLTSTPEGRALAQRFPWQGGNPEQWAQHVSDMAHEYAPSEELQKLLLQREVSTDDLAKRFPGIDQRPAVHGGIVDANVGTGRASHIYNSWMNRFYSFVGRANDKMSRHPLFTVVYRHEAERLASITRSVAEREGRTEFTAKEIADIEQKARQHAAHEVNRTLFEMGATTELEHWLRIVSPFFGAWREGLNRWWRIIAQDPSAIRKFQLGFDAPRRLGLVVDENGDPVKPGDSIGDNHYILLQIPQAWTNAKHPWKTDYRVSEASFNLIFQGGGLFNPGFGPMVQIPANQLAVHNPQYEKDYAAILPFGTEPGLLSPLVPAQIKAAWTAGSAEFLNHHSTQYKQFNAMLLRDMMVDWEQAHPGKTPSETELNRILEEANKRTLTMAMTKFWTGYTMPASVNAQSKFTPQLQAYRRLQDYSRDHNKPFFWADNKFIEQYGEAFFPLIGSSSLNNGGLSSTAKTVEYIKGHRHLFNIVDPSTYRVIVGGAGDGAYSQAARQWMYQTPMQPGSDKPFISLSDPRDAVEAQLQDQGWYDYDQAMTKLSALASASGLRSYLDSPILQAQHRQIIADLARKNEVWFQDYSTHNDAEYDTTLESLKVIATDKSLLNDPGRNDIKTLQQYLILRDQVSALLQQRAAYGGSASPEALSNRDLMLQFQSGVSQLAESSIWFEKYSFNSVISPGDPYLRAVA